MRPGLALLAALGLPFGAALVAFSTARPVVEARFPVRRAHPPELHDLAAMEHGPAVAASSYDAAAQHHPAFLVDRRARPTPLERWSSDPGDRHPWVEIAWGEPHQLSEIVVVHASALMGGVPLARYDIACLRGRSRAATLAVAGNALPAARHPIRCPEATGIRLDLVPGPGAAAVSILEIEAWGR